MIGVYGKAIQAFLNLFLYFTGVTTLKVWWFASGDQPLFAQEGRLLVRLMDLVG